MKGLALNRKDKRRMNVDGIKKVLDNMALLPLIFKIDFLGVKIPILYPFPVKRKIDIGTEIIEKFRIIDKEFKYRSNKSFWIIEKLLSFIIFLFFIYFFIYFRKSISDFDPYYIQIYIILILFYLTYCVTMFSCDVMVNSNGISYRRFLKWYFISWEEIEDVAQRIPSVFLYWVIPCIIVVLKNTNFSNKCIIFFSKPYLWSPKYLLRIKIEEVTEYIKYKIENSRSL